MKIVLKIDYDDAGIIKSWVGWYEWVIWDGEKKYISFPQSIAKTLKIYIFWEHTNKIINVCSFIERRWLASRRTPLFLTKKLLHGTPNNTSRVFSYTFGKFFFFNNKEFFLLFDDLWMFGCYNNIFISAWKGREQGRICLGEYAQAVLVNLLVLETFRPFISSKNRKRHKNDSLNFAE